MCECVFVGGLQSTGYNLVYPSAAAAPLLGPASPSAHISMMRLKRRNCAVGAEVKLNLLAEELELSKALWCSILSH